MYGQLPSGTIGLNFGLNLYLHPLFVYTSIKGTGESVQMCRLIGACVAHNYDKSHVLAHITEPTHFA